MLNTRPHLDDANRYANLLTAWFDQFGRERFLIMRYEELRDDSQAYLDRVCDSLGPRESQLPKKAASNWQINFIERAPKSRRLTQNKRHLPILAKEAPCLSRYQSARTLRHMGIL